MPQEQNIARWSEKRRVDQARRDAVRYAAVCFLPLESGNAGNITPPGEPWSWQDWKAWASHGTKPPETCARDEVKGKYAYYEVPAPNEAETNRILREAREQAKIGAAKGQTRERWYGRY